MKNLLVHILCLLSCTVFSQAVRLDSSRLPIIILDTRGKTIANEPKILAHMKILYNGPGKMNYTRDVKTHYNNFIAIETRGNSSQSYPQKQYGIELRDSISGADLDAPLLGMPEEEDWILYAPYNDISMLRNVLTYHLWNEMGHWGPRTRYCELMLNGEYQGIYILTESIKRGPNRVDIAKLKTTDTAGRDLTGGYIMKIDKKNNANDKSFVSKVKSTNNQNITWLYHYPDADDLQAAQENYIRRVIDSIELLIASNQFNDPVNGFRKFLSTKSFIDYFIITELTRNIDAYKASSFFYKEKQDSLGGGGQFKAGPVWDYNFAYGNASFCSGAQFTGWMYDGCMPATLPTPILWRRLLADVEHLNNIKCRYKELRRTILDTNYIFSYLNRYAFDTLDEAQRRHFTKWRILGTNPGGFNGYIASSYNDEMNRIKNWIRNRLNWMDNNLQGVCAPAEMQMTSLLKIPCQNMATPSLTLTHPFNVAPFYYDGKEKIKNLDPGLDRWVLVELRDGKDSSKIVDRRAFLINIDRFVVDTNMNITLPFNNARPDDEYYVVLRYDAHIFLMSKNKIMLRNNARLFFTDAQQYTLTNENSPVIYNSNMYGLDTVRVCLGNTFELNDSNFVKRGFHSLKRWIYSADLGWRELDAARLLVSGSKAGMHTINVYHECAGTFIIRQQLIVEVFENPQPVIEGDDFACKGESLLWQVKGYRETLWSNGISGPQIKINIPTTISVTVTDDNGCTATATKTFKFYKEIEGYIARGFTAGGKACKFYFIPADTSEKYSYVWNDTLAQDTIITEDSRSATLKVTDKSGCTALYRITCVLPATGEENESTISIYPNPNDGNFIIESEAVIRKLKLTNALGLEVECIVSKHSGNQYLISNAKKGWYILEVHYNETRLARHKVWVR